MSPDWWRVYADGPDAWRHGRAGFCCLFGAFIYALVHVCLFVTFVLLLFVSVLFYIDVGALGSWWVNGHGVWVFQLYCISVAGRV